MTGKDSDHTQNWESGETMEEKKRTFPEKKYLWENPAQTPDSILVGRDR